GSVQGAGIAGPGTKTIHNTIVADNFVTLTTREDINGTVESSSSNNLVGVDTGLAGISDADANDNQVGSAGTPLDPMLGPLADNFGPTPTFALLPGSPAIDRGNNAVVTEPTDQRGFPFV